jgi:penicillin amidase
VRRLIKVLLVVVAVVALLGVVVAGVVVWAVRQPLPTTTGTLLLPGLTAPVEVRRDAYSIPTILADTPEDLFRAQGYVHAQDRFWEMDFRRLLTAGRLSELVGADAVPTDTFLRSLAWRRTAEAEVELLSPQARSYYQAYADGVNAWLEQTTGGERGIQYRLLGLQGVDRNPEPWSIADSLAFIRLVAWDLRHNVDAEAERAVLGSVLPPNRLAQLYPPFPYDEQGTILTSSDLRAEGLTRRQQAGVIASLPSQARAAVLEAARAVASVPGTSGDGGAGSNSWVVQPERTASGGALLANDPHLSPSIPGLFSQMGLRCRTVDDACPFDVRGFSAASIPGVPLGHNGRIAWGWTTTYADTADLVLEQVQGEEYLTEEGLRPLQTRTETLQVAGGEPVRITLRSTRNGPIISSTDVSASVGITGLDAAGATAAVPPGAPPRGDGYAVALRWTGLEPGRSGEGVLALNTAGNWEQFTEAISLVEAFVQNIVYADSAGNVGYYVFGAIPIRRGYDGSVPVPGWTGETSWVGRIPFESKPHVLNPERGYLATANETVVPPGYPFLLTNDAQFAYRGDRIRAVLDGDTSHSVDDAMRLQMDTLSWLAPRLSPALLAIDDLEPYYAQAQELLRSWDGRQTVDSAAAAYFNATYAQVLALTFRDELPSDFWPSGNGRWFMVLTALLERPRDRFWDDVGTAAVETRDDILRRALVQARDELTQRMGKDPATWEWGRIHTLDLVDSAFGSSGIGPVERLFNRGPYPAGGGGGIVLANSWDASEDSYTLTNIPTFRMVVDFADLDASRWVNSSGQSGHPGSPHYVDQVPAWQSGQSLPMPWTDEAVQEATVDVLRLEPATAG